MTEEDGMMEEEGWRNLPTEKNQNSQKLKCYDAAPRRIFLLLNLHSQAGTKWTDILRTEPGPKFVPA